MHRTALLLSTLLTCASQSSIAQQSEGYAHFQERSIKALSAQQLQDLREGRGMGLSLPAELNGSPGPLHVLQLREALNVTAAQGSAIERIRAEMTSTARRLGASIIDAEAELDAAFRAGSADEATVRSLTSRIASLNGELRAAHLTAHMKTRRLLTETQVTAYNAARGYVDTDRGGTAQPVHRH